MDERLCAVIAQAIARADGVDPDELDYSLQDYVETDAVDLLARHETGTWTLSFEVPDHDVTVTSTGLVLVDGEREAVWSDSAAP